MPTSFKINPCLKPQVSSLSFSFHSWINLWFASLCMFFFHSFFILCPAQLVTQSKGKSRPGFLWLYLAMNRCSALEWNILPLFALLCALVCFCVSLTVTLPSNPFSYHALLTLTQQHNAGQLGQDWVLHIKLPWQKTKLIINYVLLTFKKWLFHIIQIQNNTA